MTDAPADYTRTALPTGGARFRLPDHDTAVLVAVCVPLLVLFMALTQGVHPAFGAPMLLVFGFLIWVATPLPWYFFRGRVEVTVAPGAVAVWRRRSLFRRTRRVPTSPVRAVVAYLDPGGDPLRLELEAAGHRPLRFTTGEPPELLRRLHADLVDVLNAVRPPRAPRVEAATAEELVVPERARFTARAGTLRRDPVFPVRLRPGEGPRTERTAEVHRLVAVRLTLVAVLDRDRVWVLATGPTPAANCDLGRRLRELCARHGGPLPEVEEESPPAGPPAPRPVRPAYSRVRVERFPDRTVFATPTDWGGPKSVTLTVTTGGTLRAEWPGFWGRKVREWPPGAVRAVRATVTRWSGEDGDSERWELRVEPVSGKAWVVPRLGGGATADDGKDCEWLATAVTALLASRPPSGAG